MAEKMNSKFSQDVLDALVAGQPLNWEKCEAIAKRFGENTRSLVACAKRQGMEYARKERTTKTGGKVETKEQVVARIAENLGISVETLDGLDKANKTALQILASETSES